MFHITSFAKSLTIFLPIRNCQDQTMDSNSQPDRRWSDAVIFKPSYMWNYTSMMCTTILLKYDMFNINKNYSFQKSTQNMRGKQSPTYGFGACWSTYVNQGFKNMLVLCEWINNHPLCSDHQLTQHSIHEVWHKQCVSLGYFTFSYPLINAIKYLSFSQRLTRIVVWLQLKKDP